MLPESFIDIVFRGLHDSVGHQGIDITASRFFCSSLLFFFLLKWLQDDTAPYDRPVKITTLVTMETAWETILTYEILKNKSFEGGLN